MASSPWSSASAAMPRRCRPEAWHGVARRGPGLLFVAAGPEAHLLGQLRSGRRIVRRHHGIVVRQSPLLAVFFRRQVVVRAQVPLEGFELLAVLKADDVIGG